MYPSLQIERELKELHEWVQVKESEMSRAKLFTSMDEMQIAFAAIAQISLDAQNKRLYFEPLKFSAVSGGMG